MADKERRKLASGEVDWSFEVGKDLHEWVQVHGLGGSGPLTFEECIELASVAIGRLREVGLVKLDGAYG